MSGEHQDIVELSRQDWGRLVTSQIARLGLTPEEYFAKKDAGEIDPCDVAEIDTKMVMKLGGDTARQDLMEMVANQEI